MKDKTTAGILALFLGYLGIHRFYLNQPVLGLLYLFTFGFCGVMPIIDALIFFTTSPAQFDSKYNPERRAQQVHVHVHQTPATATPQVKQAVKEIRRAPSPIQKRRRTAPKTKRIPDNPHKITGINKFKQYDFKGAKDSFKKALSIHYDDIATHFNLGCCYSMEEDVDKALFHLSKAVELGFKDFKRIDSHDALAFLRSEDEFLEFAANNYQWERTEPEKETEEPKKLDAPVTDILVDEDEPTEILDLNAPVKEKIILTEELSKDKEGEIPYQNTRDIFDDIFGDDDDDFSAPNPIQPTESGLSDDLMEKLKQLGNLRDKGILTDEEFDEQKKRLLS